MAGMNEAIPARSTPPAEPIHMYSRCADFSNCYEEKKKTRWWEPLWLQLGRCQTSRKASIFNTVLTE